MADIINKRLMKAKKYSLVNCHWVRNMAGAIVKGMLGTLKHAETLFLELTNIVPYYKDKEFA